MISVCVLIIDVQSIHCTFGVLFHYSFTWGRKPTETIPTQSSIALIPSACLVWVDPFALFSMPDVYLSKPIPHLFSHPQTSPKDLGRRRINYFPTKTSLDVCKVGPQQHATFLPSLTEVLICLGMAGDDVDWPKWLNMDMCAADEDQNKLGGQIG